MLLNWKDYNEDERTDAWEELEKWVWWLRSTYPSSREALPDCWPAHPDLVQELTALCVWHEEIYEPLANEVPDPEAKEPAEASAETMGQRAVDWHEALARAVQRWRTSTRCSTSECVLDKPNPDLLVEWRRRRARTLRKVETAARSGPGLLGDETSPVDAAV
ncbi:MAG: hypothetical protein ACYDGR_14225 [Candidatus Dormibacteria bacterium]